MIKTKWITLLLLAMLSLSPLESKADGLYFQAYGGWALSETDISSIEDNLANKFKTGLGIHYRYTFENGVEVESGWEHDSQIGKGWPVNEEFEHARDIVYVKVSVCLYWCR